MMQFDEITIQSQDIFKKYLNIYNPQASELTFTNLFMWRDYYRFRYAVICDMLCIIAVPQKGVPFAHIPVGTYESGRFKEVVMRLREYFHAKGWSLVFKKVTAEELAYFNEFAQTGCHITPDRDNSDYVYLTKDLITLKGKDFHAKRNHINKFLKLYEYEYVDLDPEHIDDCKRIMEEWCAQRDCSCKKGDYCEKYANEEVLDNFERLGCSGALIKVNGRFEAFTVGEMLNRDTAVIHIEKAKFDIQGLYTVINQQFCEKAWSHTTYINREQDLGQEGLRKAKLSYHPVRMVEKYVVTV